MEAKCKPGKDNAKNNTTYCHNIILHSSCQRILQKNSNLTAILSVNLSKTMMEIRLRSIFQTFILIIGKHISVRINGIDTPELRGTTGKVKEKARTAKRMVTNLCKRATILELRNIKRGKYFRIVADVYVDGQCLADILIKNGLAKPYDGGKKPQWNE